MKFFNPVAFKPLSVTFISAIIYLLVLIPLLVIHHVVPPPEPIAGANLTEAWSDLQTLSNGFHPYNSRRNDQVRDWLLARIGSIAEQAKRTNATHPVIFDDKLSNLTFSLNGTYTRSGASIYFEGTNIVVYIRGVIDDPKDWWKNQEEPRGGGGVLVNAHYDSVSTGFGATDDGMGVVTILQLIQHFSINQPRRGVVALLNNGEEDFLNGARVFSQHPMSLFPRTFLNLEGAGAGGRATLFRSTDTEVTKFYQKARLPFGSVVSSDAFKRGIIRSETDYSFFNGFLGLRGLDVAFFEPRSRYHTAEDDTRHASKASLHHMMSAAFATMDGLASDESSEFNGVVHGEKAIIRKGSDAVWFDVFGRFFAVFTLKALFAFSVTLLVLSPITVIILGAALWKVDKLYIFSFSKHSRWTESNEVVGTKGLHGLTRWPIAFILSTAAVIGLAFLLTTTNPYIVYSSPYAIWSMMFSAWVIVAYLSMDVANFLRPTSLQRLYVLMWMFIANWVILVAVTWSESIPKIASGFFMVVYFACVFLATTTAMAELFRLPPKSDYAVDMQGAENRRNSDAPLLAHGNDEGESEEVAENDDNTEEINENTSLLGQSGRTTFKHYTSPQRREEEEGEEEGGTHPELHERKANRRPYIYGREQLWSATLPSSLWLLQILLLVPIPAILVGQTALLFTAATCKTLADGNDPLPLYIAIAIFSILLLAPLAPFIHRLTYHLPTFFLLVFTGTLIYNILAFPFSSSNRLKLFFLQRIDLDTGINSVSLTGIERGPYLLEAIRSLPSAAGQIPACRPSQRSKDLTECSWTGLEPHVVDDARLDLRDWLSFNATRYPRNDTVTFYSRNAADDNKSHAKARFSVMGHDTRACKILFSQPVLKIHVCGESSKLDPRFQRVAGNGSRELRLWSRSWERTWEVDVTWSEEDSVGLNGTVVCLWSDANRDGVIPALDEAKRFVPNWVVLSKLQDGLVEGSKQFAI